MTLSAERRLLVMGAGGRDFHDFLVALRDDPGVRVLAFTAAQIPGIDHRRFPASLAGDRYPDGIPIEPEEELETLIRVHGIDEVVLSYSDLSHEAVMHKASRALAAGAGFRLLGPGATMLRSTRPVVAVTGVRTGAGKSQVSRRVAQILRGRGLEVVLIRHPMSYGDLEAMRVQRFATRADLDSARPTVEEREEYELPLSLGLVVYAGVDYEQVLRRAELEADVLVWDGGNNDLPIVEPDLHLVVADALRPGHELAYHPGEANVRLADAVIVNKVDRARAADVERIVENVRGVNPQAAILFARSPVTLEPGPELRGRRVLVVEDGPTLTHGGTAYGAGFVAAEQEGAAELVDPRPFAVGSIRDALERWPQATHVLPAIGYSERQLRELEETINAANCDVVVTGTPIELARLITCRHPIRHATYELEVVGEPTLEDILAPLLSPLESAAR